MNEACRPFREQLGSLALGHLDESERAAVQAHVDGCTGCRTELHSMREVASMLSLADPERLGEATVAPPPNLGDRVLSLVREERRLAGRRRRGRLIGLGAAAALVAVVVSLAVTLPGDPGLVVMLEPESPAASAPIEARLEERPWGTEIRLAEIRGLPQGPYVVWLREPDDERYAAGSFTAGPEGEIVLASSLALEETAGIGISDADGETMLYAHLEED
jgi:hypothetical protein